LNVVHLIVDQHTGPVFFIDAVGDEFVSGHENSKR